MSDEYSNSVATALRLIAKKGKTLTLTHTVTTTDPLTDIKTSVATTGTFSAVALDYSTYDQANIKALIGKKSKKLICASASFTLSPQVNDTVTHNGSTWTIALADELKPADTSILWTLAIVQ